MAGRPRPGRRRGTAMSWLRRGGDNPPDSARQALDGSPQQRVGTGFGERQVDAMPVATTARDPHHGGHDAAVGEPIREGEQHLLIDVERGVGLDERPAGPMSRSRASAVRNIRSCVQPSQARCSRAVRRGSLRRSAGSVALGRRSRGERHCRSVAMTFGRVGGRFIVGPRVTASGRAGSAEPAS